MQNQNAAPSKAADSINVDVVAAPEKARSWIRVCNRFPQVLEGSQDLYVAAQLTLMGIGEKPVFA